MNSTERADIRRKIGTLGRLVDEFSFLYTSSGVDAFPVLHIGKRIEPRKIITLRRNAKSTDFVRGKLQRDNQGRLVFKIEKGSPTAVANLHIHIQTILCEQIPILKGAKIT